MNAVKNFLRHFPFTLVTLMGLAVSALVTNTYWEQITDP